MLLTLLASPFLATLFGSISAIVSGLIKNKHELAQKKLDIEQDKLDKQHQLAMLDKQKDIAVVKADGDIAMASMDLDKKIQEWIGRLALSENKYVAFLNGTIRPILTIAYNIVFFYVLIKVVVFLIENKIPVIEWFALEIFVVFFSVFCMIMGFWFANRALMLKK